MATVEENKKLIADVLSTYPEKAAKKRAKHLGVYEEGKSDCGVKSNKQSLPGVMTARGLCRFKRGGLGSYQRYGPHLSRSCWLWLLFLVWSS